MFVFCSSQGLCPGTTVSCGPESWNRRAPSEAATPFEVVSFEPWKDGVVRIRIAADEPEGRVCHTFYARQEYAPSEAVGLLREVLAWLEDKRIGTWPYMEGEGFWNDHAVQTDNIRRFLAAQEKTDAE